MTPEDADELLGRLERDVPLRAPLTQVPPGTANEAVVFGDTHGDWRSTEAVVRDYQEGHRLLVGLGDYVDRAPADANSGSVVNALYLLGLSAADPGHVLLIQGNHEAVRRIAAVPHTLPEEVDELWGPDSTRYDRLLGLLERGPFAVSTPNGAYLAHAGFPRGALPSPWTLAFDRMDENRLAEVIWAESDDSHIRRGATRAWNDRDLTEFLRASGLSIMIRGHDPDLTGRSGHQGRVLTLHTSRIYERFGGVVYARFRLDSPLRSVADVTVVHASTEGKTFAEPA